MDEQHDIFINLHGTKIFILAFLLILSICLSLLAINLLHHIQKVIIYLCISRTPLIDYRDNIFLFLFAATTWPVHLVSAGNLNIHTINKNNPIGSNRFLKNLLTLLVLDQTVF